MNTLDNRLDQFNAAASTLMDELKANFFNPPMRMAMIVYWPGKPNRYLIVDEADDLKSLQRVLQTAINVAEGGTP